MNWMDVLTGVVVTIVATPILWVMYRLSRWIVDLTGIFPAVVVIRRESEKKGGLPGQGWGPLGYGELKLTVSRLSRNGVVEVYNNTLAPGDTDILQLKPGNYRCVVTWKRKLTSPLSATVDRYLTFGNHNITIGLVSRPTDVDQVVIYGAARHDGLVVAGHDGDLVASLYVSQFGGAMAGAKGELNGGWMVGEQRRNMP